jgi:hypothetical protein
VRDPDIPGAGFPLNRFHIQLMKGATAHELHVTQGLRSCTNRREDLIDFGQPNASPELGHFQRSSPEGEFDLSPYRCHGHEWPTTPPMNSGI